MLHPIKRLRVEDIKRKKGDESKLTNRRQNQIILYSIDFDEIMTFDKSYIGNSLEYILAAKSKCKGKIRYTLLIFFKTSFFHFRNNSFVSKREHKFLSRVNDIISLYGQSKEKEETISGNSTMLNLSFFKTDLQLEASEFLQDYNRSVYIPLPLEFLITFTDCTADQNFLRRKQQGCD